MKYISLDKLNIYYKCSILSGFFILTLSIGFLPLYFVNLHEIPLGVILGGEYGILSTFIMGLLEEKYGQHYRWAIIVSILRYVLFAVILFLVGLCYYKWDIKYFNIFSTFASYIAVLGILILCHLFPDKK